MRATVFSYVDAKKDWEDHRCETEAGICDHRFNFYCSRCREVLSVLGEDMPFYAARGVEGQCLVCRLQEGDSFSNFLNRRMGLFF